MGTKGEEGEERLYVMRTDDCVPHSDAGVEGGAAAAAAGGERERERVGAGLRRRAALDRSWRRMAGEGSGDGQSTALGAELAAGGGVSSAAGAGAAGGDVQ